jgi:ATP-dependent RNA helicase DDX21
LAHYKNDAVTALSATIALICNTIKKLSSRSLLTANEGFVTLYFKVDNPIRNVGYIRSMTQRTFNLTYEDTIGWRMTADSQGVIVDVKEDKITQNVDGTLVIAGVPWKDERGIYISIPKELPELMEKPDANNYSSQNNGRGGNNNYGRNNNGYGQQRRGGGNQSFNNRSRGGRGGRGGNRQY